MRPVFLPLPALLLAFFTLTLHAQSAPADEHARAAIALAQAESDTLIRRDFRIASQPLPDAIREFTRQAGVQVRTEAEIPAVHSPGVVGRFTAQEALRRLIAGTGLTAEVVDDRTLALRAMSGAYELDPVEVVAPRAAATSVISTATRTPTLLRDVPQAVTVVGHTLIADQAMLGMADVTRNIPGVTMGQGEGNRDQITMRGNNSTSTFFVDGMRDDVQYFRDLYNVERVEALKGPNALIFGRGTGGGVINRVSKEADWTPVRELTLQGGSYEHAARRGGRRPGGLGPGGVPLQRHVRELRPLPLRCEPGALRDQPHGDGGRGREHPDHGELRALLGLPDRRPRRPFVPGRPGGDRYPHLLR